MTQPDLSWVQDLLAGYKTTQFRSATMPTRNTARFIGNVSCSDNVNNTSTDIQIGDFNVDDYGADPTGNNDSAPAINDALAAAAAAVAAGISATVRLSPGTYKILSGIVIPASSITIRGAGRFATTILPNVAMRAVSLASSPHPIKHTRLQDFAISFVNFASMCTGVTLTNSSWGRIEDVAVYADNSLITGFDLSEDSTGNSPYYNTLTGCIVFGSNTAGSIGFAMLDVDSHHYGANANTIIGGHVNSVDYAVRIESGTRNCVFGLNAENIHVDHYYFGAYSVANKVIVGYVEGASGAYIVNFQTTNNEVGNYVECGTPVSGGLAFVDPASTWITNNTTDLVLDTSNGFKLQTPHAVELDSLGSTGPAQISSAYTLRLNGAVSVNVGTANYSVLMNDSAQSWTCGFAKAIFEGGSIQLSNISAAAGPTWTWGSGAPTSTQPEGSIYSRNDAGNGSIYVRQNGVWVQK